MEKEYKKALQMIKIMKIKSKKQYSEITKYFFLLNIQSLKYMSKTKDFRKIIKLAKEVESG